MSIIINIFICFILGINIIFTWKLFKVKHSFYGTYSRYHDSYSKHIYKIDSLKMKLSSNDYKAKAINKIIIDTFTNKKLNDSEIQRFKCYLDNNKHNLNQINIITLMHRCSRSKLDIFEFIDENVMFDLLDQYNIKGTITSSQGISNSIYSLKQYSDKSNRELKLISLLSKQLMECTGNFDSQSLSNIFYGLKNFTWNKKESIVMLLSLQYIIIKKYIQQLAIDNQQNNENTIYIEYMKSIRYEIERLSSIPISKDTLTTNYTNIMSNNNNIQYHSYDMIQLNDLDNIANRCATAIVMTPQGLGSSFLGIQNLGLLLEYLTVTTTTNSSNNNSNNNNTNLSTNITSTTSNNNSNNDIKYIKYNDMIQKPSMHSTDRNINLEEYNVPYIYNSIRFLFLFLSNLLTKHQNMSSLLDYQALSNILLGLKYISNDKDDIADIVIDKLIERIDYNGISNVFYGISAKELAMCIWGLQSINNESISLDRLLIRLNNGISSIKYSIKRNTTSSVLISDSIEAPDSSSLLYFKNGDEIGLCFSGLRKMNANNIHVRTLLKNLYEMMLPYHTKPILMNVNGSNDRYITMDDNQLASALYGLKTMSSSYIEVRCIVAGISQLIQKQHKGLLFAGQSIANALYGLQSMNSDSMEVQDLVIHLLHRFNPLASDYTGQHIAMICYGLKNMNILTCTTSCQSSSSSSSISSSNKLQNNLDTSLMNIDFGDVISMLLYEISKAIDISSHPITIRNIATAIYGLQGISSNLSGLRALMEVFSRKLQIILDNDNNNNNKKVVDDITGQEIAMILYGMQNMGSQWHQIQDFIDVFASFLEKSTCIMKGSELSQAFYGLRSMGGGKPLPKLTKDEEYLGYMYMNNYINYRKRFRIPRALMGLLLALEHKLHTRSSLLSSSMVASALYGLKGISSDVTVVRRILVMLSSDLSYSNEDLDSKGIGNALFGLQNMTSKSIQVRKVLGSLAIAINKSNTILNAQAVGNALYGLQGMSSIVKETRQVLIALTDKIYLMPYIKDSEYTFNGQNIGNALWGLRNMSIYNDRIYNSSYIYDHYESKNKSIPYSLVKKYEEQVVVSNIINILTIKINESNAELNGQNIGNAFYSLHSMSSDHIVIKQLLAALAKKLVLSNKPLSGLDIGMTLYGVKNMDSNIPEMRVILGALLHKIRISTSELQLRDLSMAIIGILQVTPWVRDDYLNVLSSKVPQIKYLNQIPPTINNNKHNNDDD